MDSFYDVFTGIQKVLQSHFEGCPGNVLACPIKYEQICMDNCSKNMKIRIFEQIIFSEF